MEQNKLTASSHHPIVTLVAEKGASLSTGSIRLYAFDVRRETSDARADASDNISHHTSNISLITHHSSLITHHLSHHTSNILHHTVGAVDLYAYDPLNRRAAIGIVVATEHRRKGYALAMLKKLQNLATTTYRLHTLYADIAAPNAASLALFRKAGYTECGHFKEWLELDSHFIDNIRMQKTL